MAIVEATFLDLTVEGGVNETMKQVLEAVEESLRADWEAEGTQQSLATWAGVTTATGTRANQGLHGSGSAVDLSYTTAPYIVTRTGSTLGGEAASAGMMDMRRRAAEAYDHAMAFGDWGAARADVSIRVNDTIEATYDRFATVSEALGYYFAGVIDTGPARVDRRPIPGAHELPDADPGFAAIGPEELAQPADDAITMIEKLFAEPSWQETHAGWPLTPEQQYWQTLRDYEAVRIPMVFGNPADVVSTRNPARGFLPFRRELVCTLIHVGDSILGSERAMRWGASDFGAKESGDVMHFDLGRHLY
jgi:hypothetical protein